jgi:hypothetical protein
MAQTTTCLFSVLCIARSGPKLGVGEKKYKKNPPQKPLIAEQGYTREL